MERGGRRWSPAAWRPRLPRRGRVQHAALPPPCVVILFPCPNLRPKAQCTRSVTCVCYTFNMFGCVRGEGLCAQNKRRDDRKGVLWKAMEGKVHSDFFASRGEYAHTGHRPTQTTDWQSERRRGARRGEQGMARQNIVGSARLQNQRQPQHRPQNQRGGHHARPGQMLNALPASSTATSMSSASPGAMPSSSRSCSSVAKLCGTGVLSRCSL